MSAPEPAPSTEYPPQEQQPGSYPPQQPGDYPPPSGYPAEAYPPQQPGAYPPQQPGAYPPQQPGAYPPQQPGAYPPQQPGAYPPQPGYPAEAYLPQKPGAYPPQQSAPPPYDYNQGAAAGAQQQASTNVVVVQQPQRPPVVYQRHYGTGDYYALLSIIMTVFCAFCCWPALFCTIPAIIFATSAQEADSRGDYQSAKTNGNIALGLNVAAIGSYIITWIVFIIIIFTLQ